MTHRIAVIAVIAISLAAPVLAESEEKDPFSAATFSGLELRCIGPAYNSGRISDIAVHPEFNSHYYVAVASGGVWKTVNNGTTWTPIFDDQSSYSIGCVTLDPANPDVVWVGTGENNSQRSVSFGDGVYRSRDGGANWENLGLGESEHIGKILVDPRNSDHVYVAAQGPLWRSGGDRGLYKTTDGGATWTKILEISDDTGVNDVVMDPRNPDVLLASSYQRRRHVWTLINGGPESAIYKSTDAGATWRKLEKGLPEVDKGRIGLAISPADPDVVYAIIEAATDKGGVFRSSDGGETWTRRSEYMSVSPQYYNELVCDPHDVDRVYSMDTWLHVTTDGGATFTKVGEKHKHVDNHAMWIDPSDTRHQLVGCDGGVYETFDRGTTWSFKANLPITQFYRVALDNSEPFYYVYGGTQDNNTLGGPSRTLDSSGISNEDWFVTVSGDGYESQIDPTNPNIVYSEWQYGGLVRYDRASGELVDLQPQEAPGDDPDRWNWDSPLLISPHSPTRLYFASQRVYRSDDRGDTWKAVSPDLTRQIDRNSLPVMGKIWGADAVSKNMSTSPYGNLVSFTESPLVEGLLYAGADDGLISVTEDGGETWRKVDRVPGVPKNTYVSDLFASLHQPDTVFASFDNHKQADFAPYVLRSDDRGRSWKSITGDLPERNIVYTVAQDHVNPQLLFAGTEFGVFFTANGGEKWIQLKGGIPTIAVRDMEVQPRENDLVLATFGRGFYVLDDYSPLREVSPEALAGEAILFPARNALQYHQKRDRIDSRGHAFFTADNPPFGATFTYYLRDGLKTLREIRQEAEKEALEAKEQAPYPTPEQLRSEDEEREPQVVLTVSDEDGRVVRRLTGCRKKGIHRVTWDLRLPASTPVELEERDPATLSPWELPDRGPMALPGRYQVTLATEANGVLTQVSEPQAFDVVPLGLGTLATADPAASFEFMEEVATLQRAVSGAVEALSEAQNRLAHVRKALLITQDADPALLAEAERIDEGLTEIDLALNGDSTKFGRNIPQLPSISARVNRVADSQWYSTAAPTNTHRESLGFAADIFAEQLAKLRTLVGTDLVALEQGLDMAGGPWTPGRLPVWDGK